MHMFTEQAARLAKRFVNCAIHCNNMTWYQFSCYFTVFRAMEGFQFQKLEEADDDAVELDRVPNVFTVVRSYGSQLDYVPEVRSGYDRNAPPSLTSVRHRPPHTEQSATGL